MTNRELYEYSQENYYATEVKTNEFITYLENKYIEWTITKPEGAYKYWDITLTKGDKSVTAEIKQDKLAQYTGNFFCENFQIVKLSGISITKADYYFILLQYDNDWKYYKIKTAYIKELIKNNNYKEVWTNVIKTKTKGYLIPLSDLKQYWKPI